MGWLIVTLLFFGFAILFLVAGAVVWTLAGVAGLTIGYWQAVAATVLVWFLGNLLRGWS